MIRKGSLVIMGERIQGRAVVPSTEYPPPGSLCVVISNPRESTVYHRGPSLTAIKRTVDVLCDGTVFEKCDVGLLIEVKK